MIHVNHRLANELGISQDALEKHCEIELEGFVLGQEQYIKNMHRIQDTEGRDTSSQRPEAKMLEKCLEALAEKLTREIVLDKRGADGYPTEARQFLRNWDVPKDRLAYVILRYALNIPEEGNGVQSVCIKLGHQIEKDYEYYQFEKEGGAYLSVVEKNLKTTHLHHRHKVLSHCQEKIILYDEDGNVIGKGIPPLNWRDEMRFAVGKLLLECLTISTGLFEVVASTTLQRMTFKGWGRLNVSTLIIRQTMKCRAILEVAHMELSINKPLMPPFRIHPKPWSGTEGGGFWTEYQTLWFKLIKTTIPHAQHRAKRHGIQMVNDALNVIQATRFRINRKVFEVMLEAAKVGIGGLPAMDKELIRTGTESKPLAETCPWGTAEAERRRKAKCPEFIRWKAERAEAWDKWARERSKRIALERKLKIGYEYLNDPVIYFVWDLDFRGRIYCKMPYVNPQQDDSGKALLEFADGVALGEHGFRHLCIHGANVYGYDKVTLDERVRWVRDNHEKIIESAENPLDGYRFWCDADKPFNFLAFCFEYSEAHKNRIDFKSHLPVQQDGTCSGLQHYSALLRDDIGGKVVNLVPAATKSDVYGEVAIVANRLLQIDLEKGDDDEKKYAKMWLDVGVDRKVTKRNVMTFCYGATRAGFTDQLIDLCRKEGYPISIDDIMGACNYLGGINLRAVEQTLVKSMEAMKMLQRIAYFLSKNDCDIQWSNAVGLRVTQDYLKTKTRRINTWWGGTRINPSIAEYTKEKNAIGSRNGIAPNYIHSLDASHLMLTAINCHKRGITAFSFIHDSFGCPAGDMQKMSEILRETFVTMYSEDLLGEFIKDIRDQVNGLATFSDDTCDHQKQAEDLLNEFDKIIAEFKPEMGSLDLNAIQRSPYFFS